MAGFLIAGVVAGPGVRTFAQTAPGPAAPDQTDKPAAAPAPPSDQSAPSQPAPDASKAAPATSQAAPASPPEGQPPSAPSPAQPPPPPAAATPPAPASTPAPPPTKSVLDKRYILGVLGKDVKSAKGEDMGRIVDVIVDWSGQTRAAIIDFGGFLGVGSRRIAVDWNALHFEPQQKGDQITLDLTRDQVKAAPEYKEDKPVVVLGPSGAAEPIPDN
jgi:PRC-barrel domain